jgi:hypothetical protein
MRRPRCREPTIGSIIVGALFGWLSEMVAGKLMKPVPAATTA